MAQHLHAPGPAIAHLASHCGARPAWPGHGRRPDCRENQPAWTAGRIQPVEGELHQTAAPPRWHSPGPRRACPANSRTHSPSLRHAARSMPRNSAVALALIDKAIGHRRAMRPRTPPHRLRYKDAAPAPVIARHVKIAQPHRHRLNVRGPGRPQYQSLTLQNAHDISPLFLSREGKKKGDGGPSPSHIMGRQFLGGLCLQPPILPRSSSPDFAPAITDTKVRRLKPVLNDDLAVAKGKKRMVLAHADVFAGIEFGAALAHDHIAAGDRLRRRTASRPASWPVESRPLREEPPAFLCAMTYSLPAEMPSTFTVVKCWR